MLYKYVIALLTYDYSFGSTVMLTVCLLIDQITIEDGSQIVNFYVATYVYWQRQQNDK